MSISCSKTQSAMNAPLFRMDRTFKTVTIADLQASEGSCWDKVTYCSSYRLAPHRRVIVLACARSLMVPCVTLRETDTVGTGRRSFVPPRRLLLVGFFFEIPLVVRISPNDLQTGFRNNIVFPSSCVETRRNTASQAFMAMM